jgi:NAD(P)-dependent dehydrogenase (short-subunit alcohol dehydrogenase family)
MVFHRRQTAHRYCCCKRLCLARDDLCQSLDHRAGHHRHELERTALTDQTAESYAATFDTNVLGVILSMKHEVRVMQGQGSGSIINISSTYGHEGAAGASVYVGSKHAVEGITKSVALDIAKSGIRVNGVARGPTDTGMLTRFTSTPENKAAVPMGRLGLSEELANAIVFIASDEASFITGHVLNVDGGQTAN